MKHSQTRPHHSFLPPFLHQYNSPSSPSIHQYNTVPHQTCRRHHLHLFTNTILPSNQKINTIRQDERHLRSLHRRSVIVLQFKGHWPEEATTEHCQVRAILCLQSVCGFYNKWQYEEHPFTENPKREAEKRPSYLNKRSMYVLFTSPHSVHSSSH